MSNATAGHSSSNISRIALPLGIAALIFIVFPVLSEAYELQLREFSAWTAEVCLRIGQMEVTRQGTILSLPGMTFDIIPACSGSKMLRTLIFVGILWGGIHPFISPVNKLVATVLAAGIALLANGLRLTLLLSLSYMKGEVIAEGLLHDLIGLSAFAIALPGFFIVTELLARKESNDATDASPSSNMLAFTLVLTGMAYLPVISACIIAWRGAVYNQFDTFGYIFFLIGAIGWVASWKVTTADHKYMRIGSILFALASGTALISQIPGPNLYVLGVTLMISVFAVGLAYRNLHFAVRCIPFLFIIFLSLPKASEFINLTIGTEGTLIPLIVKAIATLIALSFFFLICLPIKRPFVPLRPSAHWAFIMTLSSACMLIGMLYMVRSDFKEEANTYFLPYLLGEHAEWEGSDIADPEGLDFYERRNVINRQYQRNNEHVGVMIVPSGGNRKTIHTPEYCQMGLGWEPQASEKINFVSELGIPAEARKLTLKNEAFGIQRTFIYWFGDEEGVTIDHYPAFLIADTWRKFFGRTTNWSLYVVWSDTQESSAVEFLSCLPVIEPRL